MRSRQHVVVARLNEEEYQMFFRVLRSSDRTRRYTSNRSEQFRRVLRHINEILSTKDMFTFYTKGLDF